jgi:hypothetical protein
MVGFEVCSLSNWSGELLMEVGGTEKRGERAEGKDQQVKQLKSSQSLVQTQPVVKLWAVSFSSDERSWLDRKQMGDTHHLLMVLKTL